MAYTGLPAIFLIVEEVLEVWTPEVVRIAGESKIHRGNRGGKYRIVRGRKRYDVP